MLNKYLISGFIFLTFNHASAQTFGAKQVISSSANGARSVFAVDLNGDNKPDVLSASVNDNKISWYDNLGNGGFGPQQIIGANAGSACVFAADSNDLRRSVLCLDSHRIKRMV